MLLGYARVSKGETQDTRLQETALRAAGVVRLFTEQASGRRWDRPQLALQNCSCDRTSFGGSASTRCFPFYIWRWQFATKMVRKTSEIASID